MASTSASVGRDSALPPDHREALSGIAADLRRIFGVDLRALVAYRLDRVSSGEPLHTLALVERVTFEHLAACAPVCDAWRRAGLAVPLLISREEFARTLDVFPLEYHEIITDHITIEGSDPFDGIRVSESDLRRACERQAKSHLIHLREAFLEGSREPRAISQLIAASAPAFRSTLLNIAVLDGAAPAKTDEGVAAAAEATIGTSAAVVRQVLGHERQASAATDPTALLAQYIAATERVWDYVDSWRRG
jgi:hypothetical protein